jgi:hypothetical protein
MASTRYEVRVNGRLSERARRAFCAMDVALVPAQTVVFGNLPEATGLADLLALCRAMGLEVVSVRRLPGEAAAAPGMGARSE